MSGVGTRYVRTARGVQVPAMTSHIMIGSDDMLRYHWLFENLSELVTKRADLMANNSPM